MGEGMGEERRSRKSGRARFSVVTTASTATTSSMPSRSAHSTDHSHYDNETAPSDHEDLRGDYVPESVPSLDRDLSTDMASDYLSTADASLVLGDDDDDDDDEDSSLAEPEAGIEVAASDSASLNTASPYPIIPGPYHHRNITT